MLLISDDMSLLGEEEGQLFRDAAALAVQMDDGAEHEPIVAIDLLDAGAALAQRAPDPTLGPTAAAVTVATAAPTDEDVGRIGDGNQTVFGVVGGDERNRAEQGRVRQVAARDGHPVDAVLDEHCGR
mgnify:CR=1 FL=1